MALGNETKLNEGTVSAIRPDFRDGDRRLVVALAATGILTLLMSFWLMASLMSLERMKEQARPCMTWGGSLNPLPASKKISGSEVVCSYQLPDGSTVTLDQSDIDIGLLPMMAIYVFNFAPLLVFSFVLQGVKGFALRPRDSTKRLRAFFDEESTGFQITAGALLLATGGEFAWFGFREGSTAAGAGVGVPVFMGLFTLVAGLFRLRTPGLPKPKP